MYFTLQITCRIFSLVLIVNKDVFKYTIIFNDNMLATRNMH